MIKLPFNVAMAQFVLPGVVQHGQLGDPAGIASEGRFGTTARYSRIIARFGRTACKVQGVEGTRDQKLKTQAGLSRTTAGRVPNLVRSCITVRTRL